MGEEGYRREGGECFPDLPFFSFFLKKLENYACFIIERLNLNQLIKNPLQNVCKAGKVLVEFYDDDDDAAAAAAAQAEARSE